MYSDGAELLNQTEGEVAMRWGPEGHMGKGTIAASDQSKPHGTPELSYSVLSQQNLSAVLLEDGGRMVLVNSKVILILTPEGHAFLYFPQGATAE